MSIQISFKYKGISLNVRVTDSGFPNNCGYSVLSMGYFNGGWDKLHHASKRVALACLADTLIHVSYKSRRAIFLSAKSNSQKLFCDLLKTSGKFKVVGEPTGNHGYGYTTVVAAAFPFDTMKEAGPYALTTVKSIEKKYKQVTNLKQEVAGAW